MKSLMVVLTAAAILVFVVLALLSKQPRRTYLLYMVYVLPLIDFKVTPWQFGSLTLFDAFSYIMLFWRYKDFLSIYKPNRFYFGGFCTLIFLLLLGSLTSSFITNSLLSLLSVFPVFIYARLLMVECIQDNEFINKMVRGLQFACLFSMAFLAVQLVVGLDFKLYSELNQNTQDVNGIRYPSYFHDSQKYGQFLAMLSFLFLLNNKNVKRPALTNLLLFLSVAVAMFLTGGRSAFLGLSAGVLFLLLFAGMQFKKYIIAGCLAGGVLIAIFSHSLVVFNRDDDINNSLDFRASIWKEAFNIYKAHPALGIGIGNYQDYVSRYAQDQYLVLENEIIFLDQPENGYLKILTEYGGPAFLIVFVLIIGAAVGGIRAWVKKQTDARVLLFIAPIISWLVSFVSLYSITDRRNLIVLICLCSFLIYLSNRSKIVDEQTDEVSGEPV
ncbi:MULTISPECIES: O-antigen ligase family protein [Niastella]|uniref:O-antigen ligase family protein n=1 Tax=Niastella soli TaxID=2821487 RepID=A0ABS3YSM4_9BACT|nr:O-antigen ligase family protein [Niastella soli]MBO9200844.1 O-antigen ligase family protein [Niastella soli]